MGECGSSSRDVISLGEYVDDMIWRMINKGGLRDTRGEDIRCVVRALTIEQSWPFTTAQHVNARCYMSHVGVHSVELSFHIDEQGTKKELGRASCVLVFVEAKNPQHTVPVPGRERLLQLVESSSASMKRLQKP